MNKKIMILSLFLVFLVAILAIPMAFAADTNGTATIDSATISDSAVSSSLNTATVLSDNSSSDNGTTPPEIPNGTTPNGTPPDMPNGTTPNGTPPDMPNGTTPNGTMPNGTVPNGTITATTVLTGNNFTETYGAGENFTVTLTSTNGTTIMGQHISMNLTRVSSGASKVYYATTDTEGIASLQINLAPGYYTATSTYAGNDTLNYTSSSCFNTIIVYNATTNTTSTVMIVQPFTEVYGAGENFTATLKDSNGNLLVGQHVYLNLTRVSSSASKMYYATTDTDGNALLQINLGVGSYTVTASYAGNDNYSSSTASTTITVTSNGTSPTNTTNTINTSNQTSGRLVVNGVSESASGSYSTSTSDLNAVWVYNGGTLVLSNSTVTKTGDVSSSNSENSDFYGTNAAVLVNQKSTLYISDTSIVTNATGANAIFVTNNATSNSGATAYVTNVNINTYKDKSRGLDATFGGTIIANNVTINTRGGSCAALATDRGEGTVTATNCVLNTGVNDGDSSNGHGSPCIYSTGTITAINCTGTSYVSQIGCIEGKNSITLTGCNLTAYGLGNRQSNNAYVDLGGFFIYQSMSGDAESGTAKLTATNSILTIASDSSVYSTCPMFHVTNTASVISLDNCTLNYGSNILLNVSGQDQWGTVGSNGGNLTFKVSDMSLTGNIYIDTESSLVYTLTSSTYNGAINPSSSYGTTKLTISSGSTWNLTGNSHVTSLTNLGTINYGTYTLYVNGVAYTSSNPYSA